MDAGRRGGPGSRAPISRYTLADVATLRLVGLEWDRVCAELATTPVALERRLRRWGQPIDPELAALARRSTEHPCARCGRPASARATLCMSCHRSSPRRPRRTA